MLELIHKAFSSAISEFFTIAIIVLFVVGFVMWLYVPFMIYSIKKELKRIRSMLDEKNKISLD